jgi:hypothetical protein
MSLDLQEATRRDDVFNELSQIVTAVKKVNAFPALTWVWVFDVLLDIYESYSGEPAEWNEEIIAEGITFKTIFNQLWEESDELGLSMSQGDEILYETLMDWLRDKDFLVALDNDGWLK